MNLNYNKVWEVMNDLEMVTSKICSAREILDSAIEAHENHKHEKVEHLLYAVDEYLQYYLQEFDDKFKLAWKEIVVKLKEEDPCMPPWGHSDLEYASKHKETLSCDKDDSSPECKNNWTSFWEEQYYPEEHSTHYYDYTRNDPNKENPFKSNPQYETKNGVNYNQYVKAKIESNSAWNDGWTQKYYRDIVDKYEGKKDKVVKWQLPVEETKISETDETEYFITFPEDLLEAADLKEGDQVEWVDRGDGSYLLKKVTQPLGSDEC